MIKTTHHHFYHAVRIHSERCNGDMKCVRVCPTMAIRVKNNQVTFLSELCIDCGRCIRTCSEQVYDPIVEKISDFDSFKYKIAIPSPVLYTQFGLEVHPGMMHRALKNIGFDEVVDIFQVCDELARAAIHHLKTHDDARPLISSFCPTVLRLIQVNYPNLVKYVTPFDVPREIVAKQVKLEYSRQRGIRQEDIGTMPGKNRLYQAAGRERNVLDRWSHSHQVYIQIDTPAGHGYAEGEAGKRASGIVLWRRLEPAGPPFPRSRRGTMSFGGGSGSGQKNIRRHRKLEIAQHRFCRGACLHAGLRGRIFLCGKSVHRPAQILAHGRKQG